MKLSIIPYLFALLATTAKAQPISPKPKVNMAGGLAAMYGKPPVPVFKVSFPPSTTVYTVGEAQTHIEKSGGTVLDDCGIEHGIFWFHAQLNREQDKELEDAAHGQHDVTRPKFHDLSDELRHQYRIVEVWEDAK